MSFRTNSARDAVENSFRPGAPCLVKCASAPDIPPASLNSIAATTPFTDSWAQGPEWTGPERPRPAEAEDRTHSHHSSVFDSRLTNLDLATPDSEGSLGSVPRRDHSRGSPNRETVMSTSMAQAVCRPKWRVLGEDGRG